VLQPKQIVPIVRRKQLPLLERSGVPGSRFWVLGSGFLVLGSWFWVPGSWFLVRRHRFPIYVVSYRFILFRRSFSSSAPKGARSKG